MQHNLFNDDWMHKSIFQIICLTFFSPGNYGESGMEAFKDMAAKEGICIAHSGKKGNVITVYIVYTLYTKL